MIRDRLVRLCIAILFVGIFVTGFAMRGPFDRTAAPAPDTAVEALPPQFIIDISDLVVHLRDKPQAEVDDQLRDWAVYGTLVRLGIDADELSKATFKTAPVRLPYLEEAFLFDYGRGRRALLDDRRALLFVDSDDADPTATLGRLADQVRMETGESPARFHVLAITPDLRTNTIAIERRLDVEDWKMFGPEYGYVQRKINNLKQFEEWLGEIDDVTYAGTRGDDLYVGGRRFAKSRTKNVTLEDVAALLQAQDDLASKWERFKEPLERIEADYQAETARLGGYFAWFRHSEKEIEANREKREKRMAELGLPPSAPGFSLDPQWNPAGLAEALDKAAHDPCSFGEETDAVAKAHADSDDDSSAAIHWSALSLRLHTAAAKSSNKEIKETTCAEVRTSYGERFRDMARSIREAMTESDIKRRARLLDDAMLPLHRLQYDIRLHSRTEADALTLALLDYIFHRFQILCARYDGPLDGTRVGMNLFYTDLLAKLWQSVDSHHASPGSRIPGFLSRPRMRLEREWEAEVARLPYTRLWFGPDPNAYARSTDGRAVWFQHIATRVFAAGSNPINPGKEELPAEPSRRSLGWWDHHYAAVADYEQQYHVQNQIEKWSLITGWWRTQLHYLAAVRVDRTQRFDTWYARERANLRYPFPIKLRPKSDWVMQTESLDRLRSYEFDAFGPGHTRYIEGGVTLGSRNAIDVAPVIAAKEPWTLRQVSPAAAKASKGSLRTVRARPIHTRPGVTTVALAETTRTRIGAVDLGLRNVKIDSSGPSGAEKILAITSDKGSIGSIIARNEGANVGLHWAPGEVHVALDGPAPPPRIMRSPSPVAARVVEALRVGDYGRALTQVADASAGDGARARAIVAEVRRAALDSADAQFAAGEARSAKQDYQAAELMGELTPAAKMRKVLAQIEAGQVTRGLYRLESQLANNEALLDATRGSLVLAEIHGIQAAQKEGVPSLFGKTIDQVSVVTEGGEVVSVLRIERIPNPVRLTPQEILPFLRTNSDKTVAYLKGFSFNRVDFEISPRGMLAELARRPDVSWAQVEHAGAVYKPSIIEARGQRFERMPTMSNPLRRLDATAAMTRAPQVVFIRNCDTNNDGVVSDEERAACDRW